MVGEENSHYTGKVEKYEDGVVVFMLEHKILERRKRGKIRTILLDDGDFYIACGIDTEKEGRIKVGGTYKLDRQYLSRVLREILEKKEINFENAKKSGKSIDDKVDLFEFVPEEEITGTGIANLLMKDEDKEED